MIPSHVLEIEKAMASLEMEKASAKGRARPVAFVQEEREVEFDLTNSSNRFLFLSQ
jgi:hypothetical protein